ncbi:MAG: hypothetical protein ACREFW_03465 [Rhizomicrobium sp.]
MTLDQKSHDATSKGENVLPFNLLSQSELTWWPYRSLSKTLLQTHHNAAALLEINRALADEMREIARREQDFVLNLSERIFSEKNEGDNPTRRVGFFSPQAVDEIFETAITGIRQFGQAMADAQVRSIEVFREHAREASEANQKSSSQSQAQAAE